MPGLPQNVLNKAATFTRDKLEGWAANAEHTARLTIDPDQCDRARRQVTEYRKLVRLLTMALEYEHEKKLLENMPEPLDFSGNIE